MGRAPFIFRGANWPVGSRRRQETNDAALPNHYVFATGEAAKTFVSSKSIRKTKRPKSPEGSACTAVAAASKSATSSKSPRKKKRKKPARVTFSPEPQATSPKKSSKGSIMPGVFFGGKSDRTGSFVVERGAIPPRAPKKSGAPKT